MQSLLPLASLFAIPACGSYRNVQQACVSLQIEFSSSVYYPNSTGFENSVNSYAYVGTRLRPSCILSPKSAENVSKAVKILVKYPSVEFAVRSGGHNINKGFANTDHGVTLDLSALDNIEVNTQENSVSIGVGARWEKVYAALEPHGLSVVGGRVGSVGTGGYITGGGIGFFSSSKGYACDSVTNFDVILANGTLIQANAHSSIDLFAALKGGSNNFGIVVRFDQTTFTQELLHGGTIAYDESLGEQVLDTWLHYKEPGNFDEHAHLMVFYLYDFSIQAFTYMASLYHAHPETYKGSALQKFETISPQLSNNVQNNTAGFFAHQGILDNVATASTYMHWSQIHVLVKPNVFQNFHAHFRDWALSITPQYRGTNASVDILFQSAPAAKAGNSLGLDPADETEKNLVNVLVMFIHTDASAEEAVEQELKKFTAELEDIARKEDALSEFVYLNYATYWQKVLEGYGRENVEKLKKVAKKYDPREVFQKQVRGGFKLSGVHL